MARMRARSLMVVCVVVSAAALASVTGAACGGSQASNEPTAEEAALARRVADEVYERLRAEGVLDSCSGAENDIDAD